MGVPVEDEQVATAKRQPFDSNRKTRKLGVKISRDGGATPRSSSLRPREMGLSPSARAKGSTKLNQDAGDQRPEAKVSVSRVKGNFYVRGSQEMGVPADVPWRLLTDYVNSPKIFRAICRSESEPRGPNRYLVTHHAGWRFLVWSGTYSTKIIVQEHPEARRLEFELAEPGFMKVFRGSWAVASTADGDALTGAETLQLPPACRVDLVQQIRPMGSPPGPMGLLVEKLMAHQTRGVYRDLEVQASRMHLELGLAAHSGLDTEELERT